MDYDTQHLPVDSVQAQMQPLALATIQLLPINTHVLHRYNYVLSR